MANVSFYVIAIDLARRVEFRGHSGQQKISRPGRGWYFAAFSRDTSEFSIHEVKTIKRSKRTGNKFEK